MTTHQNQYLDLLFNQDDQVCFGGSAYSIDIAPMTVARQTQYITLNALNGTRSDFNVSSFRNILLEFDNHNIIKQNDFIVRNKIPYSTLTFSGSKSIHCIISLEKSLADIYEYRQLVDDIYKLVDPDNKWLDKSCRNPSRFTRQAEVLRPDKSVVQSLIDIKTRHSLEEVMTWMRQHKNWPKLFNNRANSVTQEVIRKEAKATAVNKPVSAGKLDGVSRRAEEFLTYGPKPGTSWRVEAIFSCCDLARAGFEPDEIYARLLNVDGYLEADCERLPTDCYEMVLRSGELGIKCIDNNRVIEDTNLEVQLDEE